MAEDSKYSVQDVINLVTKEIDDSYVSSADKEVINMLRYYIGELRGSGVGAKPFEDWSFVELSKVAGSIALLKEYMAEILPRYNRNAKMVENTLKLQRANLRDAVMSELVAAGKKPTADNVEAKMDQKLFKMKTKLIYLEEHAEKIVHLWRTVNSLLDVISQRINVLQSQKSDVKVQGDGLVYDVENMQVDSETGEIIV